MVHPTTDKCGSAVVDATGVFGVTNLLRGALDASESSPSSIGRRAAGRLTDT